MNSIYFWQKNEWQDFINRKNNNIIPHAILIKGIDGVGKKHFAKCIAENLLCNENEKINENHPDLIIIKPEEQSKFIKIDQIRAVIEDANITAHKNGYKIIIIENAELLNKASSNSFLKILEEPPDNVIIILVSSNALLLIPTIKSRCQIIHIKAPLFIDAKKWIEQNTNENIDKNNINLSLALSENAPLKALDLLNENNFNQRLEIFNYIYEIQNKNINIIKIAEKFVNCDPKSLLLIFMCVINDIIKIKFSAIESIINKDQSDKLIIMSKKMTLNNLFVYQKNLINLRQFIVKNINFNQQLFFENLIIGFSNIC